MCHRSCGRLDPLPFFLHLLLPPLRLTVQPKERKKLASFEHWTIGNESPWNDEQHLVSVTQLSARNFISRMAGTDWACLLSFLYHRDSGVISLHFLQLNFCGFVFRKALLDWGRQIILRLRLCALDMNFFVTVTALRTKQALQLFCLEPVLQIVTNSDSNTIASGSMIIFVEYDWIRLVTFDTRDADDKSAFWPGHNPTYVSEWVSEWVRDRGW